MKNTEILSSLRGLWPYRAHGVACSDGGDTSYSRGPCLMGADGLALGPGLMSVCVSVRGVETRGGTVVDVTGG